MCFLKVSRILFVIFFALIFPLSSLQAQFGRDEIQINNRSKYANSYKVELRFKLKNDSVATMMVSNMPDFQGASWVDYQPVIYNWSLKPEEGVREVFAKFRYKNGEESELLTDKIIVDTTPPQNPYIKIDVPQKYVGESSFVFDLSLSANDAKYVMISNSASFYGKRWRIFRDDHVPDWRFEPGDDGPRTVYAKFRDKAGNESKVVSDQIIIDTKPPFDVQLKVNEGERFLTESSRLLKIELFARGADSMMVAVNDTNFSATSWEAYNTSWQKKLEEGDGLKRISIKFKDKAGNKTAVFSKEIILDTTPPLNCAVVIDNGAPSTTQLDKRVTVSLSAEGASFFKITNNPMKFDKVRWRIYSETFQNWALEGENDGIKTIYVKFKDEAGNISKTYKASIMLDRGF